ncbi:MAG: RdgB/HAM1 family non-canonical purine NTP pyrophosphatase [Mycoplasmatales bacterium]
MKIIIASNNEGKIQEIKKLLKTKDVYSLQDIGYTEDIKEYGTTYHINALIKAQTIAQKFPEYIIIADDSGISVEALKGEPGVYSARYGQTQNGYEANPNMVNNQLLLTNLQGISNRKAKFVSVMCVIKPGQEPYFFRGDLKGEIALEICEAQGFGYDPIFLYEGKYLSQMSVEAKNEISHRGQALTKVVDYLVNNK